MKYQILTFKGTVAEFREFLRGVINGGLDYSRYFGQNS